MRPRNCSMLKMCFLKYFVLCLAMILFRVSLYSQQQTIESSPFSGRYMDVLSLSRHDTLYPLPKEFIIEGSEKLLFDSLKYLVRDEDYQINYRFGTVTLLPKLMSSFQNDSSVHRIVASYQALPLSFKREYSLRQIEVRRDSTGKKRSMISQSSSRLFSDDFFGPGLQKSGSIVRGFSIGSNRDLSLSSGFRMQLAGKLAQDVDVTAALTDENSPIQPEGTTQTLREVDKVYVEIKHPQYSAVLGDFNLQIGQKEGGEFGRINRKLQGARGIAAFDRIGGSSLDGALTLTGATARGKYATNQFQGLEGVQGPYRLTGPNGENRLLIIAGSERVYLNGESMTRSEVNDYIIDYASGEVTFSSKRLITAASRITIDFEYSDQQFVRNLVGGSAGGKVFSDKVKFNALFFQEADDPDSPIDFTMDDTMRAILQNSGADRFKASLTGIVPAGKDSISGFGKGLYRLNDTTLNGRHYGILVYAPGDSLAVYAAYFSPVDQVPADSAGYIRIAAGQFRFAGIGQGNYLPIQFLPMPRRHQLLEMNGDAQIGPDISFSGEYAVSKYDYNRLSTLAGSSMRGGAMKFSARYNPKRVVVGGSNLGEIDLHISERFVGRSFLALDRANEVEFNRKWNLDQAASTDEEIQELSFAYHPARSIQGVVAYGALNRPGELRSTRTQINLGLADSSLPAAQYQIEKINTSSVLLQDESQWTRQRGTMDYEIARWRPGFRIEAEERTAAKAGHDSLQQGSFRFMELAPRLTTAEFSRMTATVEMQLRTEDSASSGSLNRASHSLTQIYSWQYNHSQMLSSTLTLSIRSVEFTEEFKHRGNLSSDAVLVRSQTRYTPLQRAVETDLYYEFSNQRSARMERFFIRVAKGNGNYRYLGDVNGNGVMDENDFELTRFDGEYIVVYLPSDQLYPVADVKASIRLRLQPARLMLSPSHWLDKTLHALSTETYVRVDENSKDPDTKQIYMLNFAHFLNDQTTITGSQQFTQDVFLFENNADLSFRFRYSERNGLTQFVSTVERSFIQERSVRVRSQLVREIGNQTDFINRNDRVATSTHSSRERDLVSNALLSDFSYRPSMNWEVGFTIGVTEVVNRSLEDNATANINEQGIRIVQSFPTVGQLRAEFRREEVGLENISNPPYEMTNGKAPGQSYLWQVTFDYRITANLQLSLNYNGRTEGGRSPIHFARMEARAFF